MSEKTIQNEILLQYGAIPELRLARFNTGKAYGYSIIRDLLRSIGESERLNRLPLTRYGQVGQADIMGIIRGTGRAIAIEVKRPGEKMEEDQIKWAKAFTKFGGLHILAHSPEEVGFILKREGIILA